MRLETLRSKVSGVALMFVLMLGIGIMTSATAQAQYRDNDNYRYDNRRQGRWDNNRTREYAFMLGYHNAYTEGKEAADRGYRQNYNDMPGYRNSSNGYLTWMGDRGTYTSNYRRGYEAGFKDGQARRGRRINRPDIERVLGDSLKNVYGNDRYDYDDYDRNDRRGRNDDWNDRGRNDRSDVHRIAQQNGYREGLRAGQDDRNRRRSYNYDDSSAYRNASSGYRSEYGDRNAYQQGFRDGFRRGYDEAYRGGTNSGNRLPFPWPF